MARLLALLSLLAATLALASASTNHGAHWSLCSHRPDARAERFARIKRQGVVGIVTGAIANPNAAAAPTPVAAANAAVAPVVAPVAVVQTSQIRAAAASTTVVALSRALAAPTSSSCADRTVTRTSTVTRVIRETIIAT